MESLSSFFWLQGQDARPFVRHSELGRGICIIVASLLSTNPRTFWVRIYSPWRIKKTWHYPFGAIPYFFGCGDRITPSLRSVVISSHKKKMPTALSFFSSSYRTFFCFTKNQVLILSNKKSPPYLLWR